MSQVQQRKESFLLPAIDPAWSTAIKVLLVTGGGVFVLNKFNILWSGSIDLAHHYALVAYIAEHYHAPTNAPYLAEMSFYPHYSHALAAMLGDALGSPLMGLQLVTLISIYGLWAAIAVALGTLPQRQAWTFLSIFAVLLAINHFWAHAELFGNEVISNFFFAELVAQALCAGVFTLMLLMERRCTPAILRYALCVATLHFAVRIHLLPTIELFGSLGLLVILDVIEAGRRQHLRAALFGGVTLILGCAVIVLDPAFAAMRKISANNGAMNLHLLPSLPALALFAIIVLLMSIALAWLWLGKRGAIINRHLLAYKYFACFGAATAILCLLQILLLKWSLGSEYACRKYAFALQTYFIIELALLICAIASSQASGEVGANSEKSRYAPSSLGPVLLLGLGLVLGFTPPSRIEGQHVDRLTSIERTITATKRTESATTPAKQDYVAGVTGLPWIDSYLFSIGDLAAPLGRSTIAVVTGQPVQNSERIGHIITSIGSKQWDVPTCRQDTLTGGLVVLDGRCVLLHNPECRAEYDFAAGSFLPPVIADGFYEAESTGRWTKGRGSSIFCMLEPGRPRPGRILIYAQGHLSAGPQRMLVSINEGPVQTFVYSKQNPLPVISMDIPRFQGDRLQLDFKYLDAQQASSRDLRVISVFFHKIRFE